MIETAFVGLVVIALYLYAGHVTWNHMMGMDHGTAFDASYRAGNQPSWVYHVFLALWAPMLIGTYIVSGRGPRTFP